MVSPLVSLSIRNPRKEPFAPHRSEEDRRELILWAVACAERVLPVFERERPEDGRPRAALPTALSSRGRDPRRRGAQGGCRRPRGRPAGRPCARSPGGNGDRACDSSTTKQVGGTRRLDTDARSVRHLAAGVSATARGRYQERGGPMLAALITWQCLPSWPARWHTERASSAKGSTRGSVGDRAERHIR
jgi:hypothetical protein